MTFNNSPDVQKRGPCRLGTAKMLQAPPRPGGNMPPHHVLKAGMASPGPRMRGAGVLHVVSATVQTRSVSQTWLAMLAGPSCPMTAHVPRVGIAWPGGSTPLASRARKA